MTSPVLRSCALILLVLSGCSSNGLDDGRREAIVEAALTAFEEHYVVPERVPELKEFLRARLDSGAYAELTVPEEFTKQLRADFREVTGDRHVWIDTMENILVQDSGSEEEIRAEKRKTNFGFHSVTTPVPGIVVVRIDRFDEPKYAREVAVEALEAVSRARAVIFDLRENHGGHGSMNRFLASHFFGARTQLSSLYFVDRDSLAEAWAEPTDATVPLYAHPMFLLTSERTASGGESFAYTMKHHGRATVLGERTRGAAHWKETFQRPDLGVFFEIPVATPIHPVTGKGWERVGVGPDVPIPAEMALERAIELAQNVLDAPAAGVDPRALEKSVVVEAPVERVWNAWTTVEGLKFVSTASNVELRPGGPYEWFVDLDPDSRGKRGGQGATVLSYAPQRLLSFTWTFPPSIPALRDADRTTVVVVRFDETEQGTRVDFAQIGWEEGEAWDEGRAYFDRAWDFVLERLKSTLEAEKL